MLIAKILLILVLILLFGTGIAFLIVGIKKIVSLFKEVNRTNNNSYRTVMILSLLLPLIGLLIYAVNIGSNDNLAKWALRGFKMNLLLIFMLVIIVYFSFVLIAN